MPRKAAVTVEEAVQSLKKFMHYFRSPELPEYASGVWEEISKDLNSKWNSHHVYNSVVQNRRDILTLARSETGVIVPLPSKQSSAESDDSMTNETTTSEGSVGTVLDYENNEQLFEVQLTSEEWNKIKPKGLASECAKPTLCKGVWTNIVATAISRQTKNPCAYVFKRAKVFEGSTSKFVMIYGQCKAKNCDNKLRACIEEEPTGNKDVLLKVFTRDTRNDTHEVVKRPLNGVYRKDVQKDLVQEGASNFRKRMARENMNLGDPEPPYLPNALVLRQAKKQRIHEDLGLNAAKKNNLNASIEEISERPEFAGKIEFIASSPFIVVYRSPSQLHAYKEYCKKNPNSTIIIDATGSLVKKMVRNNKTRSGPIFLYSMVINFDNLTIPVHQMLSERHNAHSIMTWIHQFMRAGAPKPRRAICDYSKALLYGLCREFNDVSLKNYIQHCFEKLMANKPVDVATHLRVDVAHILHFVSRWKCWQTIAHLEVKQFFLRCIALMIQASTIGYYKTLITYTFAVAGQKYLDTVVKIPIACEKPIGEISASNTVVGIRQNLEKFMAESCVIMRKVGFGTSADSEHLRPVDDLSDYVRDESDGSKIKCITQWVDEILASATATEHDGREMNAFFVPSFIPLLKGLAVEFPLWTNCTTPECDKNATSAPIESYFNDLKTNVLKKGLRGADNFLVTHLRDIEGGSLLFVANTARHENMEQASEDAVVNNVSSFCEIDSQKPATLQNDSDLWAIEDWGGQVHQSEFVNPPMIENEDEEGQEPGAVEVLNSWDHSYCLSEKELEHEKQREVGVSKETSNAIQCPKTAINDRITANGTYFGAYSEIRYVNSRIDAKPSKARRKTKTCLLQNGSILQQPVRINKKTYFVEATCAFDSVAQILLSAAVDHPEYDSAIKNSTNAMLQFVVHTLTYGVTRKTYTDRASLLLNWYEPTPKVQTENRTLSFTLSAYDSVYNFVNLAMTTEPSLDVIEECSQSCKRKYSLVTVSPNHTTIQKSGYGALEHALNFSPRLTKLPCFNRDCRGLMTRTNRLGIHLLIDADVRVGIGASQSIRCSLANIPTSLKLRDDKDNHIQYRLSGTVTYAANHFTGYSIRNTRKWERNDDMEQNKIPALAQTEIVPHLITYVRTSET